MKTEAIRKNINLKNRWLEIVFVGLLALVVYFSITNTMPTLSVDYGKRFAQSDIRIKSVDMADYLAEIRQIENATVLIAVKDVQESCLTKKVLRELSAFGFIGTDILRKENNRSFIGIYSDGRLYYQHIGRNDTSIYGDFLKKHYVFCKSSTYEQENTCEVWIDDVAYAVNSRGFNIVTVDLEKGQLIDSVAFDANEEGLPLYREAEGEIVRVDAE